MTSPIKFVPRELETLWRTYEHAHMEHAGPTYRKMSKHVFMAGANAMFQIAIAHCGLGEPPQPRHLIGMANAAKEITTFEAMFKAELDAEVNAETGRGKP